MPLSSSKESPLHLGTPIFITSEVHTRGIPSLATKNLTQKPKSQRHASSLANAVTSRNPDTDNYWIDVLKGYTLTHRRLSPLDCSPSEFSYCQ